MNMDNNDYKSYIAGQLHDKSAGRKIEELANIEIPRVFVTRKVAQYYNKKHKVDGIKGIQDTIRCLIEEGHYLLEDDGVIILFGEGYRVVLSPDGSAALSYKCIHRERSLPAKRSGVKSRFHKTSVSPNGLADRLDDEAIDLIVIPKQIADELALYLGIDNSQAREEIRDTISEIMDDLDDKLQEQKIKYSAKETPEALLMLTENYGWMSSGSHQVTGNGWKLTLRGDGLRVTNITYDK
jgi:hypothetical protein